MCTISWISSRNGYRLFFNRDEHILRPKAEPPKLILIDGMHTLMPIDPLGGGTWCTVNEYGMSYALLNYYQGRWPKGRLVSRGQIVKHCAGFREISEVTSYVSNLNLSKYAPFSLLCFVPDKAATSITMLRWDGKQLTESWQFSPLISSAMKHEEVFASRTQVYREIIGDPARADLQEQHFLDLHTSHLPSRSELSICMHRAEAQTVSFSQISVDSKQISFHYSDGPPCEAPVKEHAILVRA